jgi:hypothetical protein
MLESDQGPGRQTGRYAQSNASPARCGKATGRDRTVAYKTHLGGPCFTTNGDSRLQHSTDVMMVGYILDTKICLVQPMRIRVDDKRSTRVESGTENAQVRLHSDSDSLFRLYMGGLLRRSNGLSGICIETHRMQVALPANSCCDRAPRMRGRPAELSSLERAAKRNVTEVQTKSRRFDERMFGIEVEQNMKKRAGSLLCIVALFTCAAHTQRPASGRVHRTLVEVPSPVARRIS